MEKEGERSSSRRGERTQQLAVTWPGRPRRCHKTGMVKVSMARFSGESFMEFLSLVSVYGPIGVFFGNEGVLLETNWKRTGNEGGFTSESRETNTTQFRFHPLPKNPGLVSCFHGFGPG